LAASATHWVYNAPEILTMYCCTTSSTGEQLSMEGQLSAVSITVCSTCIKGPKPLTIQTWVATCRTRCFRQSRCVSCTTPSRMRALCRLCGLSSRRATTCRHTTCAKRSTGLLLQPLPRPYSAQSVRICTKHSTGMPRRTLW